MSVNIFFRCHFNVTLLFGDRNNTHRPRPDITLCADGGGG